MKYIVEITKDKMVKKFIDNEGQEFVETWIVKGEGHTGTLEPALDFQMEKTEKFNEELLCAIESDDLGDIWEVIREEY